jgi:hypothetical protein
MNYTDLIDLITTDVGFKRIDILDPYIQAAVFRYAEQGVSCMIVLKDVSYETVSSFFECNNVIIPKNMRKILESACDNLLGIDLRATDGSVIFGFLRRHNNIDFYSEKYRESLPEDMIEDTIRVTYDLQKDAVSYIKFYCKSKLDPRSKDVSRYYNFGYVTDENKKPILNSKQSCTHKKPKKDSEVPKNMLKDYKTAIGSGFEVYQVSARENGKQSYLYIKKSL